MTAIDFIKHWEGCRLEAYRDVAGILTIGYGHTRGVHPGMRITQAEADNLLESELRDYERGVDALVKVPISADQRAALVSFAYNLGLHALAGSTLLHHLNAGHLALAAAEFPKWDRAGGHEVPGLRARRLAEQEIFLSTPPPRPA